MDKIQTQLQLAIQTLDPQFKALRAALAALKAAERLADSDAPDALPMQKALAKLETAATEIDSAEFRSALDVFAAATQQALDNLAFDFARELREAFIMQGETVVGRPPTLTVGLLMLNIDIAARKGQWFYGKEALTNPIPLSLTGILKAYDQQVKRIANRSIDGAAVLQELHKAWQDCIDKRKQRPSGGRINIVEVYSEMTINRQNARFWNAPSRRTFKDYERELFVRDLVLLRESETLQLVVDGRQLRLKLGVASKNQADQASRSMWIPDSALDGQYYGDVTFD